MSHFLWQDAHLIGEAALVLGASCFIPLLSVPEDDMKGHHICCRRSRVQPCQPLTCHMTLDKSFFLCESWFPLWAKSCRSAFITERNKSAL